ncbi:hypothetical protein JCM1841_006588 [Sporobolomyces salmonicolor]
MPRSTYVKSGSSGSGDGAPRTAAVDLEGAEDAGQLVAPPGDSVLEQIAVKSEQILRRLENMHVDHSVHEELQAKLLKTYKRYAFAVESFDNSSLPKHIDAIFGEGNLAQLRTWSETSRQKWSLFYAGGDWGHCLFVETLKEESLLLERFLRALDRQAYKITLANSAASWILTTPAAPSFVCAAKPPSNFAFKPPSSTPSPPVALSETQRKAARRKVARQNSTSTSGNPVPTSPSSDDTFFAIAVPPSPASPAELLARLRPCLEPPSDLPSSVKLQTWRTFVANLFHHVDETFRMKSVEAFLDYLEERIEASEASTAEAGNSEVEKL